MEFRINQNIQAQTKVSYAIESAGPLPYDIDCGEGINIVSIPPAAQAAFANLHFDMLRPYPHSVAVKDSILHYWEKEADLSYGRIVLCDGSIGGLYLINRLFLEAGDRVLGYVPQFSEYETDVKMYGVSFDRVPLQKEANYAFSTEALLAAMQPAHKLIYLDNPNNPTGQVIPLAEIEAILTAAAKQNTCVIVDEAYGDYMPKANSAASLCNRYENLIVVKTFSKGFGLAGLRAGYLIIPEALTAAMGNITNPYAMSELSRFIAAKTIQDEAFLLSLQEKTAALKTQLYQDWKNLSIAKTCDTLSICLVTHKNPNVDLAEQFAKRKILVISGKDFYSIEKNSIRFRVPAAADMPRVLEAFAEIDAID